jgi:hypothetical protein
VANNCFEYFTIEFWVVNGFFEYDAIEFLAALNSLLTLPFNLYSSKILHPRNFIPKFAS